MKKKRFICHNATATTDIWHITTKMSVSKMKTSLFFTVSAKVIESYKYRHKVACYNLKKNHRSLFVNDPEIAECPKSNGCSLNLKKFHIRGGLRASVPCYDLLRAMLTPKIIFLNVIYRNLLQMIGEYVLLVLSYIIC